MSKSIFRKLRVKSKSKPIKSKIRLAMFALGFGLMGLTAILLTRAATLQQTIEPEDGLIAGCVMQVTDSNASGGKAINLGVPTSCVDPTPPPPNPDPVTNAGAKLPITYTLSSLTGTVRYVATNGSDSNSGTSSAPVATLARAITIAAANDTIVVRGGTYRDQANIALGKNGIRIIAYPGETPIFNGAQPVSSGWVSEGTLRYVSYVPRPVMDGGGLSFSNFSNMQNLTGDGVGRLSDQAWIGANQIQQVFNKAQLVDNKFWVDRTNNRLYMTATDVAKGNIEISEQATGAFATRDRFIQVTGTDVKIEGITITRYSPNANDYGTVLLDNTAHRSLLKNVVVTDSPMEGIRYGTHDNSRLESVTVTNVAWVGITPNQTDNLIFDKVRITNTDLFDEFTSSPVSGAIKTSKNRGTQVINSYIANNKSHGIWFDQSNYTITIAKNVIENNAGAGVFFEISDGLLLIDNYIKSTGGGQPLKMAGSSGLKVVNNTLVGGVDPFAIYTDSRSSPGCAANIANCLPGVGSYSSDRQGRFGMTANMDWMPRLDLMLNNIIAYPSGGSICSSTAVCLHTSHGSGASAPINTIIHKADSTRGIPQTVMNGNVYANGTGAVIRVSSPSASYTTVSTFTAAMAASPVSIAGIDANSKSGNSWVNTDGSPTAALTAAHNEAVAIPTNAAINAFIPAGTRHYGVTSK